MVDDRKLLEKIATLTEENNQMLRSLRRSQRWARIVHIFYWVLIIGTSAAGYYYLRPILLGILETYQKILSGGGASGTLSPDMASQILQRIRELIGTMR